MFSQIVASHGSCYEFSSDVLHFDMDVLYQTKKLQIICKSERRSTRGCIEGFKHENLRRGLPFMAVRLQKIDFHRYRMIE